MLAALQGGQHDDVHREENHQPGNATSPPLTENGTPPPLLKSAFSPPNKRAS